MNIAEFHLIIPMRQPELSKSTVDLSLTAREHRFFSLIDGRLSLAALGVLAGETPQQILVILKKLLLLRAIKFYQLRVEGPSIFLEDQDHSWMPTPQNSISPLPTSSHLWTPLEQHILTSAFRLEQSIVKSEKQGKPSFIEDGYPPSNDSIDECGEFLRLSSPSLPQWTESVPPTPKPVKNKDSFPNPFQFFNDCFYFGI